MIMRRSVTEALACDERIDVGDVVGEPWVATTGPAASIPPPPPQYDGRMHGPTLDLVRNGMVLLGEANRRSMTDLMGTFRTEITVENPAQPGRVVTLPSVLVDTGAELTWIPATVLDSLGIERRKVWHFRQADGTVLTRQTGYVVLHVAGTETTDEVVFGEAGDLRLLGARSLEGLNLRVEPIMKRLVDAGPAPAAAAA
jgi:predicted aspartyl protease